MVWVCIIEGPQPKFAERLLVNNGYLWEELKVFRREHVRCTCVVLIEIQTEAEFRHTEVFVPLAYAIESSCDVIELERAKLAKEDGVQMLVNWLR